MGSVMKIIMERETFGDLEVLVKKDHSTVYKETLNGKVYCLKKYEGWENLEICTLIDSYRRYGDNNLYEFDGVVKVHSVFFTGNIAYIRMELLEGYITLRDWLIFNKGKKQRDIVITKIFNILTTLFYKHGLYTDIGDGNWMINEKLDLKLIDLDILQEPRNTKLHFLGLGFVDLLQKFGRKVEVFTESPKEIPLITSDSMPFRKEILKTTALYEGGDTIIDVACAEGNFIGDFSRLYKKVLCFDINEKSVELAKKVADNYKNVEVHHSSFGNMNLENITADMVWIGNCLHYLFIEANGFDYYDKLLKIASKYIVIEYPPNFNVNSHDMIILKKLLEDKKLDKLYTRENIMKVFARNFDLVEIKKSFTPTREIIVLKRRENE